MATKRQMTSVAKRLGARIAALRSAAGMTQEAMAARLETAKQVLSRVETGNAIPSVERLQDIAEVLGVELRDLFDSGDRPAWDERTERLVRALRHIDARDADALLVLAEWYARQRR